MPKKIYDIRPPKTHGKAEKETKGQVGIKIKRKPTPAHFVERHVKKEKTSVWRPVLIILLIIVVAAGTYLFFKLPKADVIIWPKLDTLSFKQTVTADKSVDSVNLDKNIVPAKYFSVTKTNSQDFPATGNANNEGKASGSITIYNKYNPLTPFTFKAGTHFLSDSGKLFITFQKVVIPAATKSGSKIIPGSVKINVEAVEGGSDYNIAPSNFSIPGLKGTSYYYSVYAVSSEAMTGGYTGKVKKVTSDDIQGAKDVLTQKTTSDAVSELKSQVSSDYILLDSAIISNVTDASTQTKAGTVADNFNYKVAVTTNALAFKKSDLEQFAKDYIASQAPEGKKVLDSSFKIDYSSSVIDVSAGKATVGLDFSSGIYQDVDKNSMALSILGQNANQIRETVNSTLGDQVSKIEIKFWPFWVVSSPKNQKAINIELKFE